MNVLVAENAEEAKELCLALQARQALEAIPREKGRGLAVWRSVRQVMPGTRSQERYNPRKTQEQVRRSVARLWSYGISAFGAANGERRSKAVRKGRLCSCLADAKVVKTLRSMSVAVGHDKTCSKNCRKNASTGRNRANSRWQNTLERD